MITEHFKERVGRMKEIGLRFNDQKDILIRVMKFVLKNPHMKNTAILVKELNKRVKCSDGSVGEELWIITQGGKLATTMLRPRNRPKSRKYFKNVDYVVSLA